MNENQEAGGETPAERFGALVRDLAAEADYDLSPGGGGRAALARDTGMSKSAVGRMIAGTTLPMPQQLEAIARALRTDVRTLLVSAGVISNNAWPKESGTAVVSSHPSTPRTQPLTPDAAADAWGVVDPVIRSMLISSIEHAVRLQQQQEASGGRRGPVARE